jgi:surface antigen
MQGMSRTLAGVLLLSLAACGGRDQPPAPQPTILPALIPIPNGPLQCVPYARLVSGVAIRGDAWTWWDQAAARYSRGRAPRTGAVLVFRRTRALPLGHVAVVTRILHSREILITHANWGANAATRGRVAHDVRVIDISPGNDWSELRVWNGAGFGKVYPAHGFIYPGLANAGA